MSLVGKGKYVEQEIKSKEGNIKGHSRYARIGASVAQEYFAFPFEAGESLRVAINWNKEWGKHLVLLSEETTDEVEVLKKVAINLEKMREAEKA